MTKGFSTAVGFALVASAAMPAFAQNNKPVRVGNFYEDRASNLASSSVMLTYGQVPSDKFLNITNVSCRITLNANQVLDDISLNIGTEPGSADTNRTFTLRGIPVSSFTVAGLNRNYLNNNSIYVKVGPGRYPSIAVSSLQTASGSTSTYAACVVVGDLSDS